MQNLSHDPRVLRIGLEQLADVMENLKPMTEHLTAPAGSVLLRELANCPSIEGAFSSQSHTPLLHAMSAVHGYIVMLVHVCRTGQAEIRQLSLQCWGGETRYGRKLLQHLVQLYTALVWESTLLLALCSEDTSKPSSDFDHDEEHLVPDDFKNVSEITWDKIILTNRRVGVARIVETLESGAMEFEVPQPEEDDILNVRSLVFTPSFYQMKYFKALLGASSRLGRALAELFGLLVKLCVGSPFRQRRQNIPVPSHANAKEIARVLSRILVDGLTFEKLPPSPIPKLKLTFLICSVGFTSPMLFDDKRYAYHLILEKFVGEGGLEAFYNMFRWAMTAGGELCIKGSIENPSLPDGTGEFLDAWLLLLEKLTNPKAVLESPHIILSSVSSKNFQRQNVLNNVSEFDSIAYLKRVHAIAFNAVKYIWGHKPLKIYGSRMSESVLAVLRHIIRGENIIKNKLNDKSKEFSSYIKQLTDMGFPRKLCLEALDKSNGVVEQATEYLLSNKNTTGQEYTLPSECGIGSVDSQPFIPNQNGIENELNEEILDKFTDEAISICVKLLDELPDTVYRVCDLLIAIIQRNGPVWRDYVLDIFVEEIIEKIKEIKNHLNDVDNFMDISIGEKGTRASIRIHLYTLLFEGHANDEMRVPCAKALYKHKAIPQLLALLNDSEKLSTEFYNKLTPTDGTPHGLRKLTPKWLAPLLLLIDLYGKVSIQTLHRHRMHKMTMRSWKWYDLASARWNDYSESNNKIINDAYWTGRTTVRVSCGRQRYTISFNCMTQVNEETGNNRPVMMTLKCCDKKSTILEKKSKPFTNNFSNSSNDEDDSMTGSFSMTYDTKNPPPKRYAITDEILKEKNKNDMKMKLPTLDYYVNKNNVRVFVRLMKLGLDGDTLHALMRVCLRLTKVYDNARAFAEEGGVQTLINFKPDAGFLGFTTLATLLIRHTMEDDKTLKHAMSEVIKSRTLASLPPGYKEIIYLSRQMSAAVVRNPLLWIDTAKSMLRIDESVVRPRNTYTPASSDETRFLIKCIPVVNTLKQVKKDIEHNDNIDSSYVTKQVVHQMMHALIDREFFEETLRGEEKVLGSISDLDKFGKIDETNNKDKDCYNGPEKENDECNKIQGPEHNNYKMRLLSKSGIMKILAAASRSYPNVSGDIVDFFYTPENCYYLSQKISALTYILDFLLIVPDTHRERECSGGAKLLIASLSSCNDIRVLNMVSNEVKLALLRALSNDNFKKKYLRVRLLCELLQTMIENCPPENSVSSKSNQFQTMRSSLFHILHKKNLITDLARSTQCMDFTTLFTDVLSTINSVLEPLETLIRLSNQPSNIIGSAKYKKDRIVINPVTSNHTRTLNTVVSTSIGNSLALTDQNSSLSINHAGSIDPESSSEQLNLDSSVASISNLPTENIAEQYTISSSDSDSDTNGSEDNDEREIDENEEENDDEDDELRSEMDVDEDDETQQFIEFYDSQNQSSTASSSQTVQNLYNRTSNISELDQGGDDILMIHFTSDQSANTMSHNRHNDNRDTINIVPESHHHLFSTINDNQNSAEPSVNNQRHQISSNNQVYNQHRSITNHPLLLGGRISQLNRTFNQSSDMVTTGSNSGSRNQRSTTRQRRYQYINFNSRNTNAAPVILQRLLGPMSQISGNNQSTTTSFRDATRVVLMDNNGFGLFSSTNEDEPLNVVDQAGYLFGRSLQATLNQTPTALHWWTEESKILGSDSQCDACLIACGHLIPILEQLIQSESKIRRKKGMQLDKENSSLDLMDTSDSLTMPPHCNDVSANSSVSNTTTPMVVLPETTARTTYLSQQISNHETFNNSNDQTNMMDLSTTSENTPMRNINSSPLSNIVDIVSNNEEESSSKHLNLIKYISFINYTIICYRCT